MDFGLRGEGAVARLDVSPAVVTFPDTPVGAIGPELTTQMTSAGKVPVQITGYTSTSVPAISAFVRTGGTCPPPPFPLNVFASCTLSYTFAPSQEGVLSMDVDIVTATGSFPLHLLGTGLPETALFTDGFEAPVPAPIW